MINEHSSAKGDEFPIQPLGDYSAAIDGQSGEIYNVEVAQRKSQITPSIGYRRTTSSDFGRKVRTAAMFVIATMTSPCCSPLLIVLLVTVAAGTPLAAWLTQNLAWVYGGLTVISILSFIIGISRLRQKKLLARTR